MIAGIAETGLSYARHLAATGAGRVVAMDDAPSPTRISALQETLPDVEVTGMDLRQLLDADAIYLSPGVPLAHPDIRAARDRGVPVHGDIALFGDLANAPLIAITGTNGKSTVAQLVHELFRDQWDGVYLGGNIGAPCLDILADDARCYVLEVSSFQLELAASLMAEVAMVLNLTPDHMDRYPSVEAYYRTKVAIYDHCRKAVINRTLAIDCKARQVLSFGPDRPSGRDDLGLVGDAIVMGDDILVTEAELEVKGQHNLLNVMAALAAGLLMGLDRSRMLAVARRFRGLSHRGEVIAEKGGIIFVNDSKATNPGATLASVVGFARHGCVRLLLGGDDKGLDFSDLAQPLSGLVRKTYIYGAGRYRIAKAFGDRLVSALFQGLEPALDAAYREAVPGDVVLLAPGCASFDEFDSYASRGEAFRRRVVELAG